jgi:hypothetical protein
VEGVEGVVGAADYYGGVGVIVMHLVCQVI